MGFATGHDMQSEFLFNDGLGKFYTGLTISWTILLMCAITVLVYYRSLPFLRVRNIPLVISSVATLHVYWVLCMLAYGFNGFYPCATEYWIMSTYLPFGIALFHASNSQLLYVAAFQRRFTSSDSLFSHDKEHDRSRGWRRYAEKLRGRQALNKTMNYIAVGISVQFVVALAIFFLSKRFHPSFGIFGSRMTDDAHGRVVCRQGYEWIPSILWQLFWAWVYAPYLLWKLRDIRDANGWRLQTVCCCVVGLPASPMWLMALYLPQMEYITRYFVPPLWFVPSIMLMEICMVVVPCWQIAVNKKLTKKTLDIIAEWERLKSGDGSAESETASSIPYSRISHEPSSTGTTVSRRAQSHLYTMAALEKALQTNSTPLLLFAALKDFSGENISFLKHVQEWKAGWKIAPRYSMLGRMPSSSTLYGDQMQRKQFSKAVEIYSSFVSSKYSKFPINISSVHLKELEAIFGAAAGAVHKNEEITTNEVAPFDDWTISDPGDIETGHPQDGMSMLSALGIDDASTDAIISAYSLQQGRNRSSSTSVLNSFRMQDLSNKLPHHVLIPEAFGPQSFENAVNSIKYTVLTNTWPKFVNDGYSNQMDKRVSTSSNTSATAQQLKTKIFCGLLS